MKKLLALSLLASCSNFPDTGEISSNATYSSSGAGGGTSGTVDRSVSLTPAAGSLLVAFASVSGNTQTAPTMTDTQNGVYALVDQAYWSGGTNNMLEFVRTSLVPSSISTTLTLDTDTNTAAEIEVVAVAGMTRAGAAAVRQHVAQGEVAAATLPTLMFPSAVLSADMTITAVASADTNSLQASGWTERRDVSQTSPTTCLETATRNSGFTGTTITYGGTEDTSFAEMAVELNASAPPLVDAGVDAPAVDASALDASTTDAAPASFVHGSVSQLYGSGSNPAQVTLSPAVSESTFLVATGGKTSDINRGPTDNHGNAYALLDGHDYPDWPGYGAYVWVAKNAIGGASTTWSQHVTTGDEDTTFVIEIPGAGANPTIVSSYAVQANTGAYSPWLAGYTPCTDNPSLSCVTMTSNSVTTTGPATLVAYWFGSGPTSWGDHVAIPNNGFTNLNWWSHDDPSGYVQGYMASRTVIGAGTYSVTWTYRPTQGAILYLEAVQSN